MEKKKTKLAADQASPDKEKELALMNLEIFRDNWEKMDIPKSVFYEEVLDTPFTGKYILEPLYKGVGQTLGNSLRRILVSSLVGAAVTAVKIEGVTHEYQAIKSIREDALHIILNLKGLHIKPLVSGPFEGKIQLKGPRVVRASDIDFGGKAIAQNPDLVICNIEQEIDFQATFYVDVARGYVSAEENFSNNLPIGTIFLDSNHSPILRVKYEVENTRVRQKTDYERLIFELQTNGSITPQEAVWYACKILKEYYQAFILFEVDAPKEMVQEEIKTPQPANPHLYRNINELELSIRSINCLQNARIETIGQLVQKTETEMLKTKNFGKKSLQEIKNVLASMGLTLGMTLPNFDPSRKKTDQVQEG